MSRTACHAPLEVYYDSACAVCALEMDHLRGRDHDGRLVLVDISTPAFDAARHGFSHADLDAALHVRSGDGQVARGVPALRLAYESVGLGWLVRPTRWPGVDRFAAAAYRAFAAHRRPISRALRPLVSTLRRRRRIAPGPVTESRP